MTLNPSLGIRLMIPSLLALFCFFLLGSPDPVKLRESDFDGRRRALASAVQVARGAVEYAHGEFKAGRITEDVAKELAKAELRRPRFAGDGYYFVYDLNGVCLARGAQPTFENTNRLGTKDPNGVPRVKLLIDAAKAGGDYVPCGFKKPGGESPSPKRSHGVWNSVSAPAGTGA